MQKKMQRAWAGAAAGLALWLGAALPAGAQDKVDVDFGDTDIDAQVSAAIATGSPLVFAGDPGGGDAVYRTNIVVPPNRTLTIFGADTADGANVSPWQVVLEAERATQPVIQLESGATLIITGITLAGGSTGITLMDGANATINRCYIRGNDAGVSLSADAGTAAIANSSISGNNLTGIRVQGGELQMGQCTLRSNTGPGIQMIDGTANIVACLFAGNVRSVQTGPSVANQAVVLNGCLLLFNGVDNITVPGISIQNPVDATPFLGAGVGALFRDTPWLGKLQTNLPGDIESDVDAGALPGKIQDLRTLDLRGAQREATTIDVGAEEYNGAFSGGGWLSTAITPQIAGPGTRVSIELTVANLGAVGTLRAYIVPELVYRDVGAGGLFEKFTAQPDNYAIALPVTALSSNLAGILRVNYVVSGTKINNIPIDGRARVYLRAGGQLLGDRITGGLPVAAAATGPSFLIDVTPPTFDYSLPPGDGNRLNVLAFLGGAQADTQGPLGGPSEWGPTQRVPIAYSDNVIAAPNSTAANSAGPPQAFFNQPLGPTFFNVATRVIDQPPVIDPALTIGGITRVEIAGFPADGPSGGVITIPESPVGQVFGQANKYPVVVSLARGGGSAVDLVNDTVTGTITIGNTPPQNPELSELNATWSLNIRSNEAFALAQRGEWVAGFTFEATDRAGNRLASAGPVELWWMTEVQAAVVGRLNGTTTSSTQFGFRITGRNSSPQNPTPCRPYYFYSVYEADDAAAPLAGSWRRLVEGNSPIGAVTLPADLFAPGKIYGILASAGDEAGNLDPAYGLLGSDLSGADIANIISDPLLSDNFDWWRVPGGEVSLDTAVSLNIWYDTNNNGAIDAGETQFGQAARVPRPQDLSVPVRAKVTAGVVGADTNVPLAFEVQLELYRDGVPVVLPGDFIVSLPQGDRLETVVPSDDFAAALDPRTLAGLPNPATRQPARSVTYLLRALTSQGNLVDANATTISFTIVGDEADFGSGSGRGGGVLRFTPNP